MKLKRNHSVFLVVALFSLLLVGCSQTGDNLADDPQQNGSSETRGTAEMNQETIGNNQPYNLETKVQDVINDPVFENYGRLIFPADRQISANLELQDVESILTWYSNVNPEKTVEITNYLYKQANDGQQIFYDIYSKEEKQDDPDKENTGLFFFRGDPNEKFAILNAGGGFSYVAGMHDSFPHALALSDRGYNAFALIYRPGAQTAAEDLARAIAFIHQNAEDLQVDIADYSLWGGSAGARMAAWLGSNGTASYGEENYPRPATVVMQYTSLSEVTGDEPATYANVGTRDGIASQRSVENYINRIKRQGTDTEIEVFEGLDHGFGLGENTVADGWIENAIAFWEKNSQ